MSAKRKNGKTLDDDFVSFVGKAETVGSIAGVV